MKNESEMVAHGAVTRSWTDDTSGEERKCIFVKQQWSSLNELHFFWRKRQVKMTETVDVLNVMGLDVEQNS